MNVTATALEMAKQRFRGVAGILASDHTYSAPCKFRALRGPSFMKPFFIRYDNRIAHMITKTAQAQDQSPINLQANY